MEEVYLGKRSVHLEFKRVIENDTTTYFLKDAQHLWGILNYVVPETKRKLNVRPSATVSQVLEDNQWRLPYRRGWHDKVINFYQVQITIKPNSSPDQKWIPYMKLSVASATYVFQVVEPVVTWYKIVWFRHHLPRFAIILWLTCWKRISTQIKI